MEADFLKQNQVIEDLKNSIVELRISYGLHE